MRLISFYERSLEIYERSNQYMSAQPRFMCARLSNMSVQSNLWALRWFYERFFVEYVRSNKFMSAQPRFMCARLSNMSVQSNLWALRPILLALVCRIWAFNLIYERSASFYERSASFYLRSVCWIGALSLSPAHYLSNPIQVRQPNHSLVEQQPLFI